MPGSRSVPSFVRGLPRSRQALNMARAAHEGQRRTSDGAPFICHPLAVAELLFSAHAADEVIAAGLLHDTVEKTDMTVEDIDARMGPRVAAIVAAVTEDRTIADRRTRKRALSEQVGRSDRAAALVYAADKIAKLAELRRTLAAEGVETLELPRGRAKLEHYTRSAAVVEQVLGPHPLVLRLQADLRAIRHHHTAAAR